MRPEHRCPEPVYLEREAAETAAANNFKKPEHSKKQQYNPTESNSQHSKHRGRASRAKNTPERLAYLRGLGNSQTRSLAPLLVRRQSRWLAPLPKPKTSDE